MRNLNFRVFVVLLLVGWLGYAQFGVDYDSEKQASPSQISSQIQDVIVPDFQVNECSGAADQESPQLAANGQGQQVIVWIDQRNGLKEAYLQRYQETAPVGENIRVEQVRAFLDVAIDSSGKIIIVWSRKKGVEDYAIEGKVYDFDGTVSTPVFRLDAGTEFVYRTGPKVALDKDHNFWVVWEERHLGAYDYQIIARKFQLSGQSLSSEIAVSGSAPSEDHFDPRIVVNRQKCPIIVWQAKAEDSGDIYYRRLAENGDLSSEIVRVNDDTLAVRQSTPAIALMADDGFFIVWEDNRVTYDEMYGQRFNAAGEAIGSNLFIGKGKEPSVVTLPDGSITIGSIVGESSNPEIELKNVTSDNSITSKIVSGSQAQVDFGTSFGMGLVSNDDLLLTWADLRNGDTDVFSQVCDPLEESAITDHRVNDDLGSNGFHFAPKVAVDQEYNFLVVWMAGKHIWAEKFDPYGNSLSNEIQVDIHGDDIRSPMYFPEVACDASGKALVVWWNRNETPDCMMGQFLDSGATPIASNFKVSESSYYNDAPNVVMNDSGYAVVVWNGNSAEHGGNLFLRCYAPDGSTLGEEQAVADSSGSPWWDVPGIAVDEDGSFIVSWTDKRSGEYEVYFQRYARGAVPIGGNVAVPFAVADYYAYPMVLMDSEHHFHVVAVSHLDERDHLWVQSYDSNAEPIGSAKKIVDVEEHEYFGCTAAIDEDDHIIIECNGDAIYGNRFDTDWTDLSGLFRIVTDQEYYHDSPHCAMRNGRIYSVWISNKYENTGMNIWANVLDWSGLVDVQPERGRLPERFNISQNYPNPFNASTVFAYELPKESLVKLSIYDLMGRRVKELVNHKQAAGVYTLIWDAGDLPSGGYIVHFEADDFSKTQKCLLLK